MTGTTPSVYHPAASNSKLYRSGPLGRLLRVSGNTAWFQRGELRGEPFGPAEPERESWWEPVRTQAELETLVGNGHHVESELPSIFGPIPAEALAWVLVEVEDRYVVDLPGFASVIDRASRDQMSSKTMLRFIARAVAHLAPETPARASEVRDLLGVRAERVRRARPESVNRQRPFASVGLWLDRLNPGSRSSARRVRSATPPTVRPLGGPSASEEAS